ncbi:TOG array regulator of axonemal microtubules protein 2-like [Frankliniella occidentalis]|uniref:TOG array regulator of axonemal microtubules protein 2-like n=1 Tax=Frankliniella occidentalis TaxID=133901 RepID=A0A9C6UAS7_FRAOC|nr:TOG array regulator of axonemal microtubules protein 2-like [Frankliniella occidentalis]XP_052124368.1 TOG array regulator of axonemal microtubules protein 2-like [Frankliniella occidentalis]
MGSGRAPDASPPCVASAQPGVVRRVDISPPPKQQSAATRSRAPARPGRGVRVPLRRPRATTPGSLASSGGSASLVGLANGSLSSSLGNSTASLFADTLPGFENPREALNRGLQQLESTEWEVTMQALQTVVRLVRHHPALVQGQLHTCSESLAKQVKNLRSQVARAACQASSHLFCILKRGMDAEAEDLSTALFSRTADTNKFLRADANTALDTMTDNITPSKAVSAIVHKGCRHQNAVVRAAGARLLARLVEKLGVERIMSQPRETRDLLLLTSARLLMEGSLETRSYTKSSLKNLAQDHRLSSILVEIVPSNVMRSIDKTLKSCILRK